MSQEETQTTAVAERPRFPPVIQQPVAHVEKWKQMCEEDPDLRQLSKPDPLDTDQDGKTKRCLFFGVSLVAPAVAADSRIQKCHSVC